MTPQEALVKFHNDQNHREHSEHQNVLLALGAILNTKNGKELFSYIFKNFDVTGMPEQGLQGNDLHEYLGFLRAGNSLFKLASEASSEVAATLLANTERRRYDNQREQYRIENGIGFNDDEDGSDGI